MDENDRHECRRLASLGLPAFTQEGLFKCVNPSLQGRSGANQLRKVPSEEVSALIVERVGQANPARRPRSESTVLKVEWVALGRPDVHRREDRWAEAAEPPGVEGGGFDIEEGGGFGRRHEPPRREVGPYSWLLEEFGRWSFVHILFHFDRTGGGGGDGQKDNYSWLFFFFLGELEKDYHHHH